MEALIINRILEIPEQIKLMEQAKLFYEESKLDPKKKYVSDFGNDGEMILYNNKKKIIKVIYAMFANNRTPTVFIFSLMEYKPVIRDGKIHNPLCEFAIGDTCNCPCNEKYHGWKGVNLQ
jgi:hypothetical protein